MTLLTAWDGSFNASIIPHSLPDCENLVRLYTKCAASTTRPVIAHNFRLGTRFVIRHTPGESVAKIIQISYTESGGYSFSRGATQGENGPMVCLRRYRYFSPAGTESGHTLQGSFSAVLKPIFATVESSRRNLQKAFRSTAPASRTDHAAGELGAAERPVPVHVLKKENIQCVESLLNGL